MDRLGINQAESLLKVAGILREGVWQMCSWANFNESAELKDQIEAYRRRYGVYPEPVHADRTYRTRENLRYCKEHRIRLSGPRFGRRPKVKAENAARNGAKAVQSRQDELDRIPIEGKFGQGERRFGIGRLMTILTSASETVIARCIQVIDLEKWLSADFCVCFSKSRYQ